jgi:hypothetical protein
VNDHTNNVESEALVVQESGTTADLVELVGFLGEGPEGHRRLYADPERKVGMDIRSEDIVYRHGIPAEHDELGGRSVIWVEREAMRAWPVEEEEPAERLQATFLTGPLASGMHLPEARAGLVEAMAVSKGKICKMVRSPRPFCRG